MGGKNVEEAEAHGTDGGRRLGSGKTIVPMYRYPKEEDGVKKNFAKWIKNKKVMSFRTPMNTQLINWIKKKIRDLLYMKAWRRPHGKSLCKT